MIFQPWIHWKFIYRQSSTRDLKNPPWHHGVFIDIISKWRLFHCFPLLSPGNTVPAPREHCCGTPSLQEKPRGHERHSCESTSWAQFFTAEMLIFPMKRYEASAAYWDTQTKLWSWARLWNHISDHIYIILLVNKPIVTIDPSSYFHVSLTHASVVLVVACSAIGCLRRRHRWRHTWVDMSRHAQGMSGNGSVHAGTYAYTHALLF